MARRYVPPLAALRNLAIVLLIAAAVYFVPGGGDAANLVGALLSALIITSFVLLAARFYREHRYDLDALGDRWRAILYGAIGVAIVTVAASRRLFESGAGTLLWMVLIAGASYSVYLVWRHHRDYA
jgi:hypothetical protein